MQIIYYRKSLKVHPCWCLSGAGEVVSPGEEVPHPDWGEELPKAQQQHEGGEQEPCVTFISQPEEKYAKLNSFQVHFFLKFR